MSTNESKAYFDLHIHCVGYFNRIQEVNTQAGNSFLTVSVAALWGSVENPRYTYFECRVSGQQTQELVHQLMGHVNEGKKVLAGSILSDLSADNFTFKKGALTGKPGTCLKSRLLQITWVRIEGQPFYTLDRRQNKTA